MSFVDKNSGGQFDEWDKLRSCIMTGKQVNYTRKAQRTYPYSMSVVPVLLCLKILSSLESCHHLNNNLVAL